MRISSGPMGTRIDRIMGSAEDWTRAWPFRGKGSLLVDSGGAGSEWRAITSEMAASFWKTSWSMLSSIQRQPSRSSFTS
ncbi:hypothetical protein D3C86_2025420 [compost metagenome]